MNALVLEDGNYSASLSAVRALGRLGHRVTVAATFETPAGASRWCDAFIISPSPRDADRYLDFLTTYPGQPGGRPDTKHVHARYRQRVLRAFPGGLRSTGKAAPTA